MKQGFFQNDGLQKWDGIERLPNDKGPFVGRMGAQANARPDEQPCAERFATSLCTNGFVQDLTLEEVDLTLEEADVKSELTLEESGAEPDAKDLTTDAPAASSTDMHAASTCLQHPSFDAGACDQALRTRLDDTVGSSATPPPGARVPARRPRWRHLAPRSVPLTFDDVELWFIEEEVMVALLWEELSGVRATHWDMSDSDS